MSATLIIGPQKAAETVCHEEQLRIWAHDHIVAALGMAGFLRDDLTYAELIELEQTVMRELKAIVEIAFDHPEARTILRPRAES